MGRYILLRIFRWVPTVLVVLLLVYALVFFGAGDPIKLIFLRAPGDVAYDETRVEAMREAAGLNRPFIVQFGDYVLHLVQGNFGNSLVSGRAVGSMLASALPITLKMGFAAVVILSFFGIIFGVIAALNQNTWLDNLILSFALAAWGIPVFVTGPLLMVLFVSVLGIMEVPHGFNGIFSTTAILPLIVMAIGPMSLVIRQTRNAVLEVLGEDYIRTAKSKGIPERVVVIRHIMRPVLTPVVSQIGLIALSLMVNAILIETVFGIPGMGGLTVRALMDMDYPIILAVVFVGSTIILVINLVVDIIYPLLDPRALAKKETKE